MTVELRPLGVACNFFCDYCYQEPMRLAGNIHTNYNVEEMIKKADETGQPFSLFGGEALLVPLKDLEVFFRHSFKKHGYASIQTNGSLINEKHIRLFKKYNVHVGVSIDGPQELNSLRTVRNKKDDKDITLETTRKIMSNISKLKAYHIDVSIIITLHKVNAGKERLPRLLNFLRWLGDIGIKNGNIHALEVDKTMPNQIENVLSQEENIYAMKTLADFFEENQDLKFNPFEELKNSMENNDIDTNCTWNFCDPMNTQAVYGIEGNGDLSNCGRTNKEGIDWYKANDLSFERYISLYNTPQEYDGCQGCRFFVLCGGSCPGESIANDFRNKTIHCETQKFIMEYYEKRAEEKGIIPFSKRKDLPLIEEIVLNNLMNHNSVKIHQVLEMIEQDKSLIREIEVRG